MKQNADAELREAAAIFMERYNTLVKYLPNDKENLNWDTWVRELTMYKKKILLLLLQEFWEGRSRVNYVLQAGDMSEEKEADQWVRAILGLSLTAEVPLSESSWEEALTSALNAHFLPLSIRDSHT